MTTVPTEIRGRYLRERVLTATPAQRVVMLYDRLHLDLVRTADAIDVGDRGRHADHALAVVAELAGSLRVDAGGPAENLSAIYGYLLAELLTVRGGATGRLPGVRAIVSGLRDAWTAAVAAGTTGTTSTTGTTGTTGTVTAVRTPTPPPARDTRHPATATPVPAGAWVG